MKSRWIQGTLLASAVALTLAGCGQKQLGAPAPTAGNAAVQMSATPVPTATPQQTEPTKQQLQVKAYFSDDNLSLLIEQETTISYPEAEGPYAAALAALKQPAATGATSLFADVTFNKVTFDAAKSELTVDLSLGANAQLGAPGEDLFLQALKKTVFQFQEIQTLVVLKDGEAVESLMGHMDLPNPIKRPNSMSEESK